MNWLRTRSEEFDVFTGQALIGSASPFEIVRNSIVRIDDNSISSRFVEASVQLIAELIYQLTDLEKSELLHVERTIHLLADTLELLASLPERILRLEKTFDFSLEKVHALLNRTVDHPLSDTASSVLLQAAFQISESFLISTAGKRSI